MRLACEAEIRIREIERMPPSMALEIAERFDLAGRRYSHALLGIDEVVDVVAEVEDELDVVTLREAPVRVEPSLKRLLQLIVAKRT